jgi:hypothetical protein
MYADVALYDDVPLGREMLAETPPTPYDDVTQCMAM